MQDICLQAKQRQVAESEATVIVYGGGAGSGKTRTVVHEAAKWFDVAGYTAVVFRRTSPELRGPGGIWDETAKIYRLLGGEPVESRLQWDFPEGAAIQLSHLQLEKDKFKWQGRELAYIGFDEATQFSEEQVWYLFSRLRTTCGVPTRMLLTCNPDPDSFIRKWIEWYLDADGFPIPERSGVVRWFARRDGKMVWFDSHDAALEAGHEDAVSFTFISALIWDNPALLRADPTYVAKLRALPPIEQARLLGGNWHVRPASGDYFQEAHFPVIPRSELERRLREMPRPTDVVRVWRAWDFAGTPVDGDQVRGAPSETRAEPARDADWSWSWKVGLLKDGRYVLLDATAHRDHPGAIEWLVQRTAERDGRECVIVMWQDPAQAGKHQTTVYKRLLRGHRFVTHPTFNPLMVAKLASQQSWQGRILRVEDLPHWSLAVRQLEAFPAKDAHDDAVSALGLAIAYGLEIAQPGGRSRQIVSEPDGDEDAVDAPRWEPARNDVRTTSRFREYF